MKTFFILVWCLIPTIVFADFRPGRVRAVAQADMIVTQSTGVYDNVKHAKVILFAEDGVGPVKIQLKLGERDFFLPIDKVKNTGCGNFVWPDAFQSEIGYTVSLFSDYSQMICARYEENEWKISLETRDSEGQVSLLQAEGKPEYFMLTM